MASYSDFVRGLRALGPPGAGSDFVVTHRGVPIRVRAFDGSAEHMVLETPYLGAPREHALDYRSAAGALLAPRPMDIVLRRESAEDVRGKERGVAIEVQTGDPDFDARVYVDSPSRHDVSRAVLAAAPLRAAVRALLDARAGPLTIDTMDAAISLRLDTFGGLPADVGWTLEHFATIATSVPEVRASSEARPASSWLGVQLLLGAAAILGILPTLLVVFTVLPARCYVTDDEGTAIACSVAGCCEPAGYGLAVGLAVGLVAAAVAWHRIRGTSNAHTARPWIASFVVALVAEVGITVAHIIAAVLG